MNALSRVYKQSDRANYDISNFLIRIMNGVGEFRLAVKLHDFKYIFSSYWHLSVTAKTMAVFSCIHIFSW